MSLDTSKTDRDDLDHHIEEANAAIIELHKLRHAGKTGKPVEDAIAHRSRHMKAIIPSLVKPSDGVLAQLEKR